MKKLCITGVSRGVGKALAERFLLENNLVWGGARSLQSEGVIKLQQKYGDLFHPVQMDVNDTSSLSKAQETITKKTDHLDILVNNAGIYLSRDLLSFDRIALDGITHTINTNSLGPLRTSQALYPLLKQSSQPLIVNVTSVIGSIKLTQKKREYGYAISKAALNMLTRLMSLQLAEEGFTVFCIHPGWVKTDMGGLEAPLLPEQSASAIYKQIVQGKEREHEFINYLGDILPW